MSVSLEALAMAGMDSNEWAVDAEEWERYEMENHVPPHLLADEDENENEKEDKREGNVTSTTTGNYKFPAVGFFGKDGRAEGSHSFWGIICNMCRSIEKRAYDGLNSERIIMVRAILGFLMVMTINIITAQRSKSSNK